MVESADDFFEPHSAATDRAEIPTPALIAEREVAGQDARAPVEGDARVLHVRVVDAGGERADEFRRVNTLPDQVAGVVVEAKFFPVVDGVEGPLSRVEIEGDLGRMHLQGELDPAFLEDVEDGVPAVGELGEARVDHRLGGGGEVVDQVPDARPGEAIDHRHTQLAGGAGGVLHFLGSPLIHLGGVAIAPDVVGQNGLVADVDIVADRLAHQVVRDGEQLEVVLLEQFAFAGAVGVVGERLLDFEVISPAGQFETIKAPLAGLLAQHFQGQVGPLAGEQRDGTTRHRTQPSSKGKQRLAPPDGAAAG